MQCKNYRAYTMAEAMAAVKADLGADAIVLHTRTTTQGGFLGLGRRTVIEITAARAERNERALDRANERDGDAKDRSRERDGARDADRRALLGGAATRAYGAADNAAKPAKADAAAPEATQLSTFDRERTRLLAQAMAIKLEREQAELPRTGAPSAAAANAAATERRAAAATAPPATEPRVAQRFVLIPANDAARAVERQSILQRVPPRPEPGRREPASDVDPPRGPIANRPLSIAPDAPREVRRPAAAPTAAPVAVPAAREMPRPSLRAEPTVTVGPVEVDGHLDDRTLFAVAPAEYVAPAAPSVRTVPIEPAPNGDRAPSRARADLAANGIDLAAIDRLVEEVLRRPSSTERAGDAPDERMSGRMSGREQGRGWTRGADAGPRSSRPQRLEDLYATLLGQDLGDDLADAIVTDLQATLSPEELASDHAVRSAATQRIAALLPTSGPGAIGPGEDHGWRRDGRPLTVAFVGPTGVGKTTTVAKIAASLKLRYGARVGLVTCDTYRIAAVDQLRTYADIIGLPLEVVLSPGQMRQARQRLEELDVVLIDTAGRSQNDADRLSELAAMVKAAEPHETHLVLSSTAHEKVLLREAQAFSTVGVDRVVLTKLDEAVGLGAVLRVLRQVGRGVSYLTTGQEVPQHIEAARPSRLAELVLGGAPRP